MFLWKWLLDGVSWILVQFHQLLSPILGDDSGWAWTLSIVGLVVVIRILLIPLFVKQIRAQRNMQAIQPQLKELLQLGNHLVWVAPSNSALVIDLAHGQEDWEDATMTKLFKAKGP